jgi:hypothetical protein
MRRRRRLIRSLLAGRGGKGLSHVALGHWETPGISMQRRPRDQRAAQEETPYPMPYTMLMRLPLNDRQAARRCKRRLKEWVRQRVRGEKEEDGSVVIDPG